MRPFTRTEAHAWADGRLRQQDWAPFARDFLCQAAEAHQAAVGSVEYVTGNHLTMDHTQSYGCVGHLRSRHTNILPP